MESWKDISGFDSRYQVSDLGNVRSLLSNKILKPSPTTWGHLQVSLSNPPIIRRKDLYVHRLVLEAFVGEAPDEFVCRHLNGNPSDNRLENLQWGTQTENARDRWEHERIRLYNNAYQCGFEDGLANASVEIARLKSLLDKNSL